MAHILAVDDDAMMLRRIGQLLDHGGHLLEYAKCSAEANLFLDGVISAYAGMPFDLIICDNHMRVRNEGVSFAQELWLLDCKIPFILHTSSGKFELPRGWEKWSIHYVHKEPSLSTLRAKINELLVSA